MPTNRIKMESLPKDIQNHIFYYWAEHPAATVIRDYFQTRCDACDKTNTRWYDDIYLKGFFCKSCYDRHVEARVCVNCGQPTEGENNSVCFSCGGEQGDDEDEDED